MSVSRLSFLPLGNNIMLKLISALTFGFLAICGTTTHGATVNMFYDDFDDGIVLPSNIIGVGTFSYDGPLVEGTFLLSDLTGVSFDVTFTGATGTVDFTGPPFDPADSSLIGISVTDIGGGDFELVFTGESAMTGGSLDIDNVFSILSHEPDALLAPSVGPKLYFATDLSVGLDSFGDYLGTTAIIVPEPSCVYLLSAICGLTTFRRRR
tara:strand:- start:10709 stop:11335 length:627 start_codon:yes stop_codon:yes gene_type:complete